VLNGNGYFHYIARLELWYRFVPMLILLRTYATTASVRPPEPLLWAGGSLLSHNLSSNGQSQKRNLQRT
jgi:hypothetical protein